MANDSNGAASLLNELLACEANAMTKLEMQMAEALRELLTDEPDIADSRTAFVWDNARTALNSFEHAEVQPKHSQMLRLQGEAQRLAQEITGDPRRSVTVQANTQVERPQ